MSPRGRSRLVDTPERITIGGKPSAHPRRMDDEFASSEALRATSGIQLRKQRYHVSRGRIRFREATTLGVTRFSVNPESTSTLGSHCGQAYINYVYEATLRIISYVGAV
jgi:hypothetical protein